MIRMIGPLLIAGAKEVDDESQLLDTGEVTFECACARIFHVEAGTEKEVICCPFCGPRISVP